MTDREKLSKAIKELVILMVEEELPVEILKGKGGIVKVKAKASKKAGNGTRKPKRFLAELATNQAKALALVGQRKAKVI